MENSCGYSHLTQALGHTDAFFIPSLRIVSGGLSLCPVGERFQSAPQIARTSAAVPWVLREEPSRVAGPTGGAALAPAAYVSGAR